MPLTFKEFLDKEGQRLKQEGDKVKSLQEEWIKAIRGLFEQMTTWIAEVDTSNVLRIRTTSATRNEPELGVLDVPMLEIWLGNRLVLADPVAYRVVGPRVRERTRDQALGRVDLRSMDQSFKLYRFVTDDHREYWVLIDDATFESKELTKETFETALLGLLQ